MSHKGIEWLEKFKAELKSPLPFGNLVSVPSRRTPMNLIEAYLGKDYRRIEEDMALRPDHYSEHHRELFDRLKKEEELTRQEANELFYRWQETSSPKIEELRQKIARRSRSKDDPEATDESSADDDELEFEDNEDEFYF
jgi:hypothetical protein